MNAANLSETAQPNTKRLRARTPAVRSADVLVRSEHTEGMSPRKTRERCRIGFDQVRSVAPPERSGGPAAFRDGANRRVYKRRNPHQKRAMQLKYWIVTAAVLSIYGTGQQVRADDTADSIKAL